MIELNQISLIAVAGNKQGETITALYKCMRECKFATVKLITNIDIKLPDIEVINVGGLDSWEKYNYFIVKELTNYFDTDMCLIVQYDSWILNGDCWNNEFLNYDLVSAKWLDIGKPYNVGNGGFSLRSKRLQDILSQDKFITTTCPEDVAISKVYGQYLIDHYGIKFASEDVADKFSFELNEPTHPTFGFHNFHWRAFTEHVVIKRDGACGDLIMAIPLMDYYHKKGYQVVLDTKREYMDLFQWHQYWIKHISQMNANIKPIKSIDLNQAYEVKPKQSVLESYYEMAGIEDGKLINSKLNFPLTNDKKLFKKYILIHNDETNMSHRNCHGVNWSFVVDYYVRLGYLVFQIGRNIKEEVAPYLNTEATATLLYALKGADCVIAIDSGVAQMSVALGTPTVIFFGSVDSKLRYHNFENIEVIHSPCVKKEDDFCYHSELASQIGVTCKYDKKLPPCTNYDMYQVMKATNKLLNK